MVGRKGLFRIEEDETEVHVVARPPDAAFGVNETLETAADLGPADVEPAEGQGLPVVELEVSDLVAAAGDDEKGILPRFEPDETVGIGRPRSRFLLLEVQHGDIDTLERSSRPEVGDEDEDPAVVADLGDESQVGQQDVALDDDVMVVVRPVEPGVTGILAVLEEFTPVVISRILPEIPVGRLVLVPPAALGPGRRKHKVARALPGNVGPGEAEFEVVETAGMARDQRAQVEADPAAVAGTGIVGENDSPLPDDAPDPPQFVGLVEGVDLEKLGQIVFEDLGRLDLDGRQGRDLDRQGQAVGRGDDDAGPGEADRRQGRLEVQGLFVSHAEALTFGRTQAGIDDDHFLVVPPAGRVDADDIAGDFEPEILVIGNIDQSFEILIGIDIGTEANLDQIAVPVDGPGRRDGKDAAAHDRDLPAAVRVGADRGPVVFEDQRPILLASIDALDGEGMESPVGRPGPVDRQLRAVEDGRETAPDFRLIGDVGRPQRTRQPETVSPGRLETGDVEFETLGYDLELEDEGPRCVGNDGGEVEGDLVPFSVSQSLRRPKGQDVGRRPPRRTLDLGTQPDRRRRDFDVTSALRTEIPSEANADLVGRRDRALGVGDDDVGRAFGFPGTPGRRQRDDECGQNRENRGRRAREDRSGRNVIPEFQGHTDSVPKPARRRPTGSRRRPRSPRRLTHCIDAARRCRSAVLGRAPRIVSTTCPCLNSIRVGIAWIRNREAVRGFS